MNEKLKREVIKSDDVLEAIFDYVTSPIDTKHITQAWVGQTANMVACKKLRDKGWSNKAIAEELEISEDSVKILLTV